MPKLSAVAPGGTSTAAGRAGKTAASNPLASIPLPNSRAIARAVSPSASESDGNGGALQRPLKRRRHRRASAPDYQGNLGFDCVAAGTGAAQDQWRYAIVPPAFAESFRETVQQDGTIFPQDSVPHVPSLSAAGIVTLIPQPGQPKTKRKFTFFDFPAEIRNSIYAFGLRYPDSQTLYSGYYRRIDEFYRRRSLGIKEKFPVYKQAFRCPTLLLLCTAITAECFPMLQDTAFVIDRLPPWIPRQPGPMLVSQFMSKRTLQSLRRVEIRVPLGLGTMGSGWAWQPILSELFETLMARNAFKQFRVVLPLFNLAEEKIWTDELTYLEYIQDYIDILRQYNPHFWRPGVVEEHYWVACSHRAIRVALERKNSNLYEYSELRTEGEPWQRFYPDRYIWPGSLLEFI